MVSDSAALVMLAIRSAVRLGQQLRTAYIESTQRREMVLPLPNYFSQPGIASAITYFDGDGQHYRDQIKQLAALRKKARLAVAEELQFRRLELRERSLQRLEELLQARANPGLSAEEEDEVCAFYEEFRHLDQIEQGKAPPAKDSVSLNAAEFNALLTIRQWKRGTDPNPSVLQRFVGTFIEIGIDYFQNVPGALNKNSAQGKLIASFLDAMGEIPFADGKLGELPQRLFIAALETISEHSELVTGNDRGQALIKVTAKAISVNAGKRLDDLRASGKSNLLEEERVGDWAELIFRSVLSSAGQLVVEDPQRFLGLNDPARAALVTQVGDTVLGLVLDQPDGELDHVFSRESLDTVMKAALKAVGEHPEIITGKARGALPALLSEIASELSEFDSLIAADLLPDLTRLILEKTGDHLDLIWPDFAKKPQNHLLLATVSTTLSILTKPPANGSAWAVEFTRADLLGVVNTVLDEVVANPAWLVAGAAKIDANLQAALEATLGVLRKRADERLGPATGLAVLRAAFLAVASRQEFLRKLPPNVTGAGLPFVAAVLDVVLAAVFSDKVEEQAAWQLLRASALENIVRISVGQLAKTGLGPNELQSLVKIVTEQIKDLEQGSALDLADFAGDLAKELGVV